MAKKKRTQLKPVARGFATTSVPKKFISTEEDAASQPTALDTQIQQRQDGKYPDETQPTAASEPPSASEFDPEKVEEQSLQNLVDKLQEKTEKEIMRTLKALEVDRRYAQTLPTLDLNSSVVSRILDLALELCPGEKKPLDGPEDRAVARLAITYGVLRRLGFSDEKVEACLKEINGLELEEAYDWLYLHCTESELSGSPADGLEDTVSRTPRTPATPPEHSNTFPKTPVTPRTPADFLAPSSPPLTRRPTSRLNAQAPSFIPSGRHIQALPAVYTPEGDIDRSANYVGLLFNEDSALDDNELTMDYVRTKLEIASLTTHRSSAVKVPASKLQQLQSKLFSIKQDYLFDEREAEALYQKARKDIESDLLRERLLGNIPESVPRFSKSDKKRPPSIKLSESDGPVSTVDVLDQVTDDEPGFLSLLEELPTSETNLEGRTIMIRDMALPKNWSGRTPKLVLQEIVRKSDKYAVITYSVVSGQSRAKQAAVQIRWHGKRSDEWRMEDVACHSETQAEQYVATVALHALTFPSTEGFAAGNPGASNTHTFFRLLPPVYRDLWDELGDVLKAKNDEINRKIWGKLRSIIETKTNVDGQFNVEGSRTEVNVNSSKRIKHATNPSDSYSDQIKESFQSLQSTSSYQEMLEHRNKLPIAHYRNEIVSILEHSQVLVLSGETWCGKSTQVPTFILEDHLSQGKPCKVYCTEPRRISAISLAQRVSRELGEPPNAVGTSNSLVGYSIRLESNTSKNTRLAFVTNGIALRMLEGGSGQGGQGTAFDEITHIVIDEVHERTIESDFLLIVLKSLLEQRSDLK